MKQTKQNVECPYCLKPTKVSTVIGSSVLPQPINIEKCEHCQKRIVVTPVVQAFKIES